MPPTPPPPPPPSHTLSLCSCGPLHAVSTCCSMSSKCLQQCNLPDSVLQHACWAQATLPAEVVVAMAQHASLLAPCNADMPTL